MKAPSAEIYTIPCKQEEILKETGEETEKLFITTTGKPSTIATGQELFKAIKSTEQNPAQCQADQDKCHYQMAQTIQLERSPILSWS